MIAEIDLSTDTVLAWSNLFAADDVRFFDVPAISEPWLYDYVPETPGQFDINGFVLKSPSNEALTREERQLRADQVVDYMNSLRVSGELSQYGYDKFLYESSANMAAYVNGGGSRFATWIRTVNDNGYNASVSGFKTDPDYRGPVYSMFPISGIGYCPRADHILSILGL